MKLRVFLVTFIAFFVVFAAGALSADSQTVSGSLGGGSVARGSTAKGSIVLNMPSGLHVNSNRPNSEYSIATTVRISGQGIKTAGISYPRGHDRKFQFADNPINVYEGRVIIPFSVRVPGDVSRRYGEIPRGHSDIRLAPTRFVTRRRTRMLLLPPASDDGHQPAGLSVELFFDPIRKEQVRTLHRT